MKMAKSYHIKMQEERGKLPACSLLLLYGGLPLSIPKSDRLLFGPRALFPQSVGLII